VVGHDAVGEEWDREPLAGLTQHLLEGEVVARLLEQGGTARGPIQDVVGEAAGGVTESAWHAGEGIRAPKWGQDERLPTPFLGFADTRFYAGVDLRARSLYLAVLDRDGGERFSRNLAAAPGPFLQAVAPFRGKRKGVGSR
jgi:hypothetical protein